MLRSHIRLQSLLKHLYNFILISFIYVCLNNECIAHTSADNDITAPLIWNLRHYNEHFVGRKEFLKNMHSHFFEGKNNLLVVSGSSGSGKAAVIQRYAEQHQATYNIVWWLDIKENLKEQYRNFALEWNRIVYDDPKKHLLEIKIENLNEDEIIKQVNDRFRITKLNWLIIIDKVQEISDCTKYIPKKSTDQGYGHVIISTKNSTIHDNAMRIDKLAREESIELLIKTTDKNDRVQANLLAETLEDNPLAIARAGLFISSYDLNTIEEYNHLFKNDRQKIWQAEKQLQNQRIKYKSYKSTLLTSNATNIEEIKKESNLAYELLSIISFINNEDIPENVLGEYFKFKYNKESNDIDFKSAISTLLKNSIIYRYNDLNYLHKNLVKNKESFLTTNKLTQLSLQDLQETKEKLYYIDTTVAAINHLIPVSSYSSTDFILQNPYMLTHILKVLHFSNELNLHNNETLKLQLHLLGYYLYGRRDDQKAEQLIDLIDTQIKSIKKVNALLKIRLAIFKSAFLDKAKRDHENSFKQITIAHDLIKKQINPPTEESFLIYRRLAKRYNSINDSESASKYVDIAKQFFDQNSELQVYQKTIYKILIKIALDRNDYTKALEYSNIYIGKLDDNKNNKQLTSKDISIYLQHIDILTRLKQYQKAHTELEWLLQLDDDLFLTFKTAYKPNAVIYHSYINSLLNNSVIPEKIRIMLEAQQILKNTFGEKRYYKNLYAYRHHLFLGEIYELTNNYKHAEEEYYTGYETLIKIYNSYNNTNTTTDDFSEILSKLAIINVKLEKSKEALQHLKMHKQMFGDKHQMSMKLVRYFVERKVSVRP